MKKWHIIACFVILSVWWTVQAIGEENVPTMLHDEGGVVLIEGQVTYTNPFFTAGVTEPLIVLEDQHGFFKRDNTFTIPIESQVLGQITSDFTQSPFRYQLALPIMPQGTLNDINRDGVGDVMIFAVAYWANVWGDTYLEKRDQQGGGWSRAYASTDVSHEALSIGEYVGGKILVYAPQDAAPFPHGFGEDGKLFTADDPLIQLPAGYTLVSLDTVPFTFDRSQRVQMDLLEGEAESVDDFSLLSYTQAFDSMIEKFRREYAFTAYKNINWDALSAEFRPLIERAESDGNADLFALTLTQFSWRIPDGHVSASLTAPTYNAFIRATARGLGFAIREIDDGRVVVNFVVSGSEAEQAGITLGTQIIALNNRPIEEVVTQAQAWSAPFSTLHVQRLQQLRYAVRFPVSVAQVTVTYQNPADSTPRTITLNTSDENESFAFSSLNRDISPFALPIETVLLPSGYLHVKVNALLDDQRLTILLWERMIQQANDNSVRGILLDLRNNSGGRGYLADQMSAYFFEEPIALGKTGQYDEAIGDFFFDTSRPETMMPPPEDLRYLGKVAVLVSPNCMSACEFFAWNMTQNNRADVVGQYPSAGLGGSVERFFMPANVVMQITTGRSVDQNGNIHIEGIGIVPTVRVPITLETLLTAQDVVLETAVEHLNGK